MKPWIGAVAVLLAGICLGAPATQPNAAPTTQPNGSPATQPSGVQTLPKPGDLLRQIKAAAAKKAALTKVAFFDLAQPVIEKPSDFSLFGGDATLTLRNLVDRLHQARDDKDIH